jgi:FkbM family methyltransferase
MLSRTKRILNRLYWKFARLLKLKTVRSAYGPKFYANYSDTTFQFYITGFYGTFLASQISALSKPFVFMDVGANQGLYSLLANHNAQCQAIYAFEPVAETYKKLEQNVALNHAEKVKVLNYAISDSDDKKQISFNPNHTGGASIEHKGATNTTQSITCISANSLSRMLQIDSTLDIFIKIDTEGHEPVVVKELRKASFWGQVKTVFFEADDDWYSSADLIQLLETDGFVEIWRTAPNVKHFDVLMKRGA